MGVVGGPPSRIPPYICQNVKFGGIIPCVTRKKFLGKNDLFQVFIENKLKMKRTVRLTESDLIRLVKRVISERFEIMGELLGKAERFLQKQGIDTSNMDENEIYQNIVKFTEGEDGRLRHIANKLKAEMLGYMGRPDTIDPELLNFKLLDDKEIEDYVKTHGSELGGDYADL